MKRDRIANELVIPFVINTTYLTNTGILTANWDTMHGGANPTNILLIATMAAWGAGGVVTIRLQHCLTSGGAYTTHKTCAVMNQTSGITCFIAEIKDYQRFIRLSFDVTVAVCTLSVTGILTRSRREPVTQFDTAVAEVAVT